MAAIEAALVLPPFLSLLLLMIQLGVYFILQAALDVGVLVTAETLRTEMAAGNYALLQSATLLENTISTNGGAFINASRLSVEVRQLSTLSAGSVAIVNNTIECSSTSASTCNVNGTVLVLRAQMTMTLVPYTKQLTITSTSTVHRPSG